jgi:L-asparaginase/Glu-tRNA(Gln) amidotransferase subunit D
VSSTSTTPEPKVVVFGLGGTIAMTSGTGEGVSPTLSVRDLVDAVPGLASAGVDMEVVDFRRLPGASLTFADIAALTAAAARELAACVTGVVAIQGTYTARLWDGWAWASTTMRISSAPTTSTTGCGDTKKCTTCQSYTSAN